MMKPDLRATLSFRVVPLTSVDDELVEKWKRLADCAIEPNPYHDPRFLVTSVRNREDAKDLRLALVERDVELLAVLAFSTKKAFTNWPIRTLSTLGPFMEQVGDLRHPLINPKAPVETWECLLRGLRRTNLPGLLELRNIPGDGAFAESLHQATVRLRIPTLERERDQRAYTQRTEDEVSTQALSSGASGYDSLFDLNHSSGSTRKQRRRLFNALQHAIGSEPRIEDRSDDPQAVEQFLSLEASGWKGDVTRGGHALRLTGHDRWFTEVATAFRADNKLAVLALTDDEHNVLYMTVSYAAGDGMFGCLDAYDERFASYSAGTFGRIAEWKYAIAQPGVRFFDPNLSSVYAESSRLYPYRRPHVTLLLAHGGAMARMVVHAIPTVRRWRDVFKTATRKLTQ